MANILESFGYENCLEDDNHIYFRCMYGFKKRNFFGHKYYSISSSSQILLFIQDLNKSYDNESRVLHFEQIKDLGLKMIFIKKYRNFTGIGLKEAVAIIDSGEITLNNEFEYDFMKSFFLQIGFNIIPNSM